MATAFNQISKNVSIPAQPPEIRPLPPRNPVGDLQDRLTTAMNASVNNKARKQERLDWRVAVDAIETSVAGGRPWLNETPFQQGCTHADELALVLTRLKNDYPAQWKKIALYALENLSLNYAYEDKATNLHTGIPAALPDLLGMRSFDPQFITDVDLLIKRQERLRDATVKPEIAYKHDLPRVVVTPVKRNLSLLSVLGAAACATMSANGSQQAPVIAPPIASANSPQNTIIQKPVDPQEHLRPGEIDLTPEGTQRTTPAQIKNLSEAPFVAGIDLSDLAHPRYIGNVSDEDRTREFKTNSFIKCVAYMVVMDHVRAGQTADGKPLSLSTSATLTRQDKSQNFRGSDRRYGNLGTVLQNRDAASVNQLLKEMMAGSRNGSTAALARLVGGTRQNFVELMNEKMKSMGMINSFAVNDNGRSASEDLLDNNDNTSNSTTLDDLVRMVVTMQRDYREHTRYTTLRSIPVAGSNTDAPVTNVILREYPKFARDLNMTGLKSGSDANKYGSISVIEPDNGIRVASIVAFQTPQQRRSLTLSTLTVTFEKVKEERTQAARPAQQDAPVMTADIS